MLNLDNSISIFSTRVLGLSIPQSASCQVRITLLMVVSPHGGRWWQCHLESSLTRCQEQSQRSTSAIDSFLRVHNRVLKGTEGVASWPRVRVTQGSWLQNTPELQILQLPMMQLPWHPTVPYFMTLYLRPLFYFYCIFFLFFVFMHNYPSLVWSRSWYLRWHIQAAPQKGSHPLPPPPPPYLLYKWYC